MGNRLTLKEFAEVCRESKYLDNTKKFLEIEISEDLIKKSGLKPKPDGFYYYSQIVDLPRLLTDNKEELKKIEDDPNDDILTIDPSLIDSAVKNIQLQHVMYFLLSEKFQKFIKEKRRLLSIPENGFESYKKFHTWINNLTKKMRKEVEEEKKFSFLESRLLIANIIVDCINRESKKYNSSVGFPIGNYWNLIYCYLIFNDPFFGEDTGQSKAKEELRTQHKIPLQENSQTGTFELNILISKNTTRDDVVKTLDKEWKIIRDWQKKLPSVLKYRKKSLDNLRRDFNIYLLSQNGLNDEKIASKIGRLKLNHVRKIISDTKKRIKETWGG